MAIAAAESRTVHSLQHNWLVRLFDYKPFLIFLCLLPAAGFLLVFLSYPLGLGIWLAFTDTRIGRMGQFIGTIEFDRILKPQDRVARSLSWFFNPFLSPDMAGHLEITQEELGLLAGVSRQVVNKSLQALQAQGMVEVSHGRIVVLDLEGLTRYES